MFTAPHAPIFENGEKPLRTFHFDVMVFFTSTSPNHQSSTDASAIRPTRELNSWICGPIARTNDPRYAFLRARAVPQVPQLRERHASARGAHAAGRAPPARLLRRPRVHCGPGAPHDGECGGGGERRVLGDAARRDARRVLGSDTRDDRIVFFEHFGSRHSGVERLVHFEHFGFGACAHRRPSAQAAADPLSERIRGHFRHGHLNGLCIARAAETSWTTTTMMIMMITHNDDDDYAADPLDIFGTDSAGHASAGVEQSVGVLQLARVLDVAHVRTPWAIVQCRLAPRKPSGSHSFDTIIRALIWLTNATSD